MEIDHNNNNNNNIFCFFSLFILISSLLPLTNSSSPPSSSISVLGIATEDENYFRTDVIKCKNGSKKFTRAQLNDDFCDCPDGTDEPGTSACPAGKFYCRNDGHLPTSIYSSRVNDGICDCCDGSDEYNGKVNCSNTCWEAGKVARDKLQKKIDMYKEGSTLRRKEVERAKEAKAKDKAELSKLKAEEKILKRLVKQLEVHKEQIEKAVEKEHLRKEKEEKSKDVTEDKGEAVDKYIDDQSGTSKALDNDKIGPLEEPLLDQNEKDGDENPGGLSKGGSESTEDLSRDELGRLVASRWTGEKSGNHDDEIDTIKENPGISKATPDSTHSANGNKESSIGSDHDGSSGTYKSGSKEEKDLSGITTSSTSSWLEKIQDTMRNLFPMVNLFTYPADKLDADRFQKEYDDTTARLSDIQTKISSLAEKLKHDFGLENEFYLLYEKCFETKQDKYVYKVCPFKDALQEEGYKRTQLGQWEKFENFYQVMLFSNGDGCWNGPDRSLKVKLRCGLKTELKDVDEPSRCEYAALMSTPVLCSEEKLKELKLKLDSVIKQLPHHHDEL